MPTTNDIWAVVETDGDGRPKRLGLELASMAAQLAAQYGGKGGAVVIGPRETADTVGQYGAAQVYYCPDPRCKSDIVGPAAAAISALIAQHNPRLVLLPSTPLGKDWAGRIAGRLGLGVESDVTSVTVDGGRASTVIPAFNGALRVSSALKTEGEQTGLVVVRPGSTTAQRQEGAQTTVQGVPVPDNVTPGFTVVESVAEKGGVPDLAGAQTIVSGGRGLGNAEKFSLVRDL